MFETLKKATLDKIFVLMAEYAADPRTGKIDLGVGVYKDDKNITPVMRAVRKAEQRILDSATTKTYKGVVGNKEFSSAIVDLALGNTIDKTRIRTVNGAGGTGALMILMHVLGRARPKGRIFISDPTWPNHIPLAENANLEVHYYPYFDAATRGVNFAGMMEVIDGLTADDIVLLHGCCHNPTGANLSRTQWDAVAASLQRTGAFPATLTCAAATALAELAEPRLALAGGAVHVGMHDVIAQRPPLREIRPRQMAACLRVDASDG